MKSERDFLVSPTPGTNFVVKGLVAQASILTEIGNATPTLNFGKKPFDWLSDAQWQMLLVWKTVMEIVTMHFFSLPYSHHYVMLQKLEFYGLVA